MNIKALRIKNFRNIRNLFYEPEKRLNIFLGENGHGKTNMIEAIYVLAQGSSFRPVNDSGLVNYDAKNYDIQARYQIGDRLIESSLSYYVEGKKEYKINGKKTRQNNSDRLRIVVFTPDDLFLVKGPPNLRRHFLDFGLSQLSLEFSRQAVEFSKLLKKRNRLIRAEKYPGRSLDILDDLFCDKSAHIVIARLNYVNILNEKIKKIHKAINLDTENLNIRYALSFNMDSGKINLDMVKQGLREELGKNRKQEIRRGGTLVGPHRDDFHIYIGQRLARNFASQGQQRNLAVSLKLAEIEAFFEVKGFYPLFLLDEVLAELDNERRLLLLNYISQSSFQSFMTTVNLNVEERDGKARVCLVRNGALQRRE